MAREIIIVGAGAAGIGAARRLKDAGHDALVLEARDRIGGRSTTAYDIAPFPVELGAEFIHGENVATWELIRRYGLTTIDRHTNFEWLYYYGGRILDQETFSATSGTGRQTFELLRPIAERWASSDMSDMSIEQAARSLPGVFPEPPTEEAWQLWRNAIAELASAEPDKLSVCALAESRYAGDGHLNYRVIEGYSELWRRVAGGLDIRLRTPVTRVTWDGTGVTIEADDERYSAECVILTLPLGVLKTGMVAFDPPLPDDKLTAIERLGAGHVDKIILTFDERFWPERMGFLFTSLTSQLWWTPGFNRPVEQQAAVLTGFFGGAAAEHYEALGANAPLAALRDLEQMFGMPLEGRLRDARFVAWGSDSWARMGYSYVSPGAVGQRAKLATPLGGRLFFAGEASNVDRPSTIHGALQSGYRAADEALAAGA